MVFAIVSIVPAMHFRLVGVRYRRVRVYFRLIGICCQWVRVYFSAGWCSYVMGTSRGVATDFREGWPVPEWGGRGASD